MNIYLFVYGTLMSGESRNYTIRYFGRYVRDVCISGFRMYDYCEGGYPVVRRTDNVHDIIVGELWELTGDSHSQLAVLSYLDEIECVPALYHRMSVTVEPGIHAVMYCVNWDETWRDGLAEDSVWPSGVKWNSET